MDGCTCFLTYWQEYINFMSEDGVITIKRRRLGKAKNRTTKKRIQKRGGRKKDVSPKKRHGKMISKQKLLAQTAASYNQGFDAGYDEAMLKSKQPLMPQRAWNQSSENDYLTGVYHGGEAVVDSILPELDILPDFNARQIIEVGVEQLRPQFHKVLSASEVAEKMMNALDAHSPLSVIRLGDGELLTLAQEVVMSGEQVRKEGHFLSYAGIQLPDLAARDQLMQAVRNADIIGIPKIRMPNFQPLAFSIFKAHGIDYRQLQLTLSTINYALQLEGFYPKILANRSVVVVGNKAPDLAQVLINSGVRVTGTIAPVEGMRDIERVMHEISAQEFDIALVAAGVPAVVIAQRITSKLGKVAIDFGHLADSIVKGESVL